MRIMDCVLLLFQKRVDPVQMDPERPCVKPSWGEALKLMSGGGFLNGLLTFPKVGCHGVLKDSYCKNFPQFKYDAEC